MRPSDIIAMAQLRLAALARNEEKLTRLLRQQLGKFVAVLDSKRYEDFRRLNLVMHSRAGDGYGTNQGYVPIPCLDAELEDDCRLNGTVSVCDSTRALLFELTGKHVDDERNDDVDVEEVVMALIRIQRARAILNAKLPRPRQNRVTKA